MQDWHSRADEALAQLREHHGSPCYQSMVQWLQYLYEREKERITMADETDQVQFHWLMAKGVKELLSMVQLDPD